MAIGGGDPGSKFGAFPSFQSFLHGKGSKKKTGFFTGVKKESIFKVKEIRIVEVHRFFCCSVNACHVSICESTLRSAA